MDANIALAGLRSGVVQVCDLRNTRVPVAALRVGSDVHTVCVLPPIRRGGSQGGGSAKQGRPACVLAATTAGVFLSPWGDKSATPFVRVWAPGSATGGALGAVGGGGVGSGGGLPRAVVGLSRWRDRVVVATRAGPATGASAGASSTPPLSAVTVLDSESLWATSVRHRRHSRSGAGGVAGSPASSVARLVGAELPASPAGLCAYGMRGWGNTLDTVVFACDVASRGVAAWRVPAAAAVAKHGGAAQHGVPVSCRAAGGLATAPLDCACMEGDGAGRKFTVAAVAAGGLAVHSFT